MSLFKARDWWSVSIGSEEAFDHGSLCVANIDNNNSLFDKVIVGSYSGVLRIYQPQSTKGDNLKAEDVLIEVQLSQPILQVEAGKFVSVSEALHLAILHPRKLAVYSITASSANIEHGTQYQMKMVFEHNLQRTAYNLVIGSFGGVKGKDFLCVQSMDGTVSFFEQESFAFTRFLPGFLLPGPLAYIPRTDSFVTVSSCWQVECYKYQILAVATDTKTKEESQKVSSGKRISMDWSFNLGEPALDIFIAPVHSGSPVIMVLGERSVVCLKDNGSLKFSKKLEYNPSCFYPYASLSEGNISYLVGTQTGQLMVYEGVTLKWVAKLEFVPITIRVGSFQEIKGVITALDEGGHMTCSYLGTDPSLFVAPNPEAREINYDEQDAEMKSLQKQIKDASTKSDLLPKKIVEEELTITAHVPATVDKTSVSSEGDVQDDDPIPSITVKLLLSSKIGLQNVRLLIFCPYPLSANQSTFTIPFVGEEPENNPILVSFYMRGNSLPANVCTRATAMYQLPSGAPRISVCKMKLPLKLICKSGTPTKSATHKVTIDTNRNSVNLQDVFPDFISADGAGSANAMGFQIYGGPTITLLSSKSSQRYRLQSDVFESMWPVLEEFLERIRLYQKKAGNKDFECSFGGTLPLQEYFELIDTHLELRHHAVRYRDLLDQRAKQFRAIQRRLLTRFKDKTPAPLTNLDTLLDGTYRQILKLAEGVEENQAALVRCSMGLSCATKMIVTLLTLQYHLTETEAEILSSCFCQDIQGDRDVGWEESVDAAVASLLRTCLSKSSKDQAVNPSALEMPSDASKLKKHIVQLTDRLAKGARLFIEGQDPGERKGLTSTGIARPPSATSRDFAPDDSVAQPNRHNPIKRPFQPLMNASVDVDDTNNNKDSNGTEAPEATSVDPLPPPQFGTPLGELPPLGGQSTKASNLPPLGVTTSGSNPILDNIRPHKEKSKKKKKKKSPRQEAESESAFSASADDDFFTSNKRSPEPLTVP